MADQSVTLFPGDTLTITVSAGTPAEPVDVVADVNVPAPADAPADSPAADSSAPATDPAGADSSSPSAGSSVVQASDSPASVG